jgi:hypothetical protein
MAMLSAIAGNKKYAIDDLTSTGFAGARSPGGRAARLSALGVAAQHRSK